MTTAELTRRVLGGDRLCLVEYRGSKPEDRTWRNPEGKVISWSNVRHAIESGNDQITVIERLPDGTRAGDAKIVYKKGDRCVLHVRTLSEEKGALTATGALEALTA